MLCDMEEERQKKPFLPSLFTKRGRPAEVLDEFVSLSRKQSALAVENVKNELGVPYGSEKEQKIDFFYPDEYCEETRIIVFFHGGYWYEGSTDLYLYPAFSITKSGKIFIVVGKVLAPQASVSGIVEQCAEAVKLICRRFPRTRGITLSGHSSGGQECAMMLSRDWSRSCPDVDRYFGEKLERVVLLCGIFELTHLIGTEIDDALKLTRDEAKQNSPLECVDRLAQNVERFGCKVVLVTVENDALTINKWNKTFMEALLSKGVHADHVFFPELDHFNLMTNMIDSDFSGSKLLIG